MLHTLLTETHQNSRHLKQIDEHTFAIYEQDDLIRVGQHLCSLEDWLDWKDNVNKV